MNGIAIDRLMVWDRFRAGAGRAERRAGRGQSAINAVCFIPPDQFDALAMNIRYGRYPTALELEIDLKLELYTIRSTVDIQH